MIYRAVYKLETSEIKDSTIIPITLEETREFDAPTDKEALSIAQWVGYHMAEIINPQESSIKDILYGFDNFSQVTIQELSNKDNGNKIALSNPGSHYADSTIRKYLRSHGEEQPVEIVGMNSYLLGSFSFVTKNELLTNPVDIDSKEIYSNIYQPLMKDKKLLENYGELIFPENNSIIIIPDGPIHTSPAYALTQ
ncbi:MAG: hypothetical protein KAT28_05740 [Candidatus Aenigmarchaeota archaeon]|nr:hypothetical protein [Candidatus Aenigmarchaeota archaeon]